jgi:GNAT superfamily N-acetyltransferase
VPNLSLVEPLRDDHDLDGFDCGEPTLNDWLLTSSRTSNETGGGRVYVTADARNSVKGYHALATGAVAFKNAPPEMQENLGPYPISIVLLTRLAVDLEFQGQGVGRSLLLDAFAQTLAASLVVGAKALMVDALHDRAAGFYTYYGFKPFSPSFPRKYFLLIDDIAASLP